METTMLNTTTVARQTRDRIIGVRMNQQEAAVVEALAEETGLSMSDVVRLAVRKAHAPRFKRRAKKTKR